MYRLLIVDNEEYVVDGLVELFRHEKELDLEVLGAYSSSEGLKCLMSTKIDIVITDIRMPGMSGLELQKVIVSRWPRCKVIFLSGYDDFNYAQEAMRVGSSNYILKTEGDEVIVEAVRQATLQLQSDTETQNIIMQAKQKIQQAADALRREYFSNLILGDSYAYRTMEKQFSDLCIPLSAKKPVFVAVVRIDEWSRDFSFYDKSLLQYGVQNIAQEHLDLSTIHSSFVYERSKMIWLIQPKSDDWHPHQVVHDHLWRMTQHFIYGSFESIQSTCVDLLHLPISVTISREAVAWMDLRSAYEKLSHYFEFGMKKQLLIVEADNAVASGGAAVERIHTQEVLKQYELLNYYLENNEGTEFFSILQMLMETGHKASSSSNSVMALQIASTVSSIMLSFMENLSLKEEPKSYVTDIQNLLRPESLANWKQTEMQLFHLAEVLFEHKSAATANGEEEIVYQVNHYIQRNLGGDLTLKTIAQEIGHNPSYLSRLYKQKAGQGLSETILDARLNRAKELLIQPQYKINDVSKMVGFLSEHYFYRFFKRATRLTPQEFRELEVNRRQ
ncbi:two-component system, response regulator YesN [Paenibacillus sp. yr247]|uniref:response regulator transcription factor n=1 Tax=Paenibacillus sp. yr247 TaxID=1761880 RepID=UPI00087E77D4|nr:response regulator [Paenibacillus sp. yr247]SDO19299.1 two-component system, response regulator YesN [Paenibacillus sp. yr247]